MVRGHLKQVLGKLSLIKEVLRAFKIVLILVLQIARLTVSVYSNLDVFAVGSVYLRLVYCIFKQLE